MTKPAEKNSAATMKQTTPQNEATDSQLADKKVQQLIEQDRAEKDRFKHLKINFKENRFGPLIFAVLFAGIGAIFIFTSSAAPQHATPEATAKLWLTPASQQVNTDSTVTTEIWVDSANEPVNAVQASINYPADRLAYVGTDAANSGFAIDAQASGANGKVTVVRGTTTPVTGKQLVARVSFRAQARGTAKIDLTDQSQLLRSSDNRNILSSRTGAQYSIGR